MRDITIIQEKNRTLVAGKAGCGKSRIINEIFLQEYKENMDNCVGVLIDTILYTTQDQLQFINDCYHNGNDLFCIHLDLSRDGDIKKYIKSNLEPLIKDALEKNNGRLLFCVISEKFYDFNENDLKDIFGNIEVIDVIEGIQMKADFNINNIRQYIILDSNP